MRLVPQRERRRSRDAEAQRPLSYSAWVVRSRPADHRLDSLPRAPRDKLVDEGALAATDAEVDERV
jgi:hypothetical protein